MTKDFDIRPTEPADIPAIQAIYAREVNTGTASFELIAPSIDDMHGRFKENKAGGYGHFVAILAGQIVGYAYTGPYRPRPAYRHTVENSVYVAPGFRGRGIAGSLLQTLIEDCDGKPFHQMIAIIGDRANLASINLHKKFGFDEVGVLSKVGYKFDQWVDTVIMQRGLK